MEKAETSDILIATASQNDLLEMLLSTQNYTLVLETKGQAMLAYLREHTPQLIMVDTHLPDLNGINLCERIKKVPRLAQVPLMLLVSAKDTNSFENAKRCAYDALVTTPLTGQDIRAMVAGLLGKETLSDNPINFRRAG